MRRVTTAAQRAIDAAPLFRRLPPAERMRLAGLSSVRSFGAGEVVFWEGDQPSAFWVIVEGRVKISRTTPQGREVILELFGPGDPFGAVAVFEGFPFPATATALEPTTAITTPRDAFFGLLDSDPLLVRTLLSSLTLRLVELTQRVVELSAVRVESRIALLFCRLAREAGAREGSEIFIPQPMSRQQVADLCGTTLETTIRIMSRWGKLGIVHTARDGFRVPDLAALENRIGS